MQHAVDQIKPYLISLCTDRNLEVERSKRFFTREVKSIAHLAELISLNRFWSPIVWNHGHNLKVNFREAYYLCLDLDDGSYSLTDVMDMLVAKEYAALIYTTTSHQKVKSNQPPCDRFRIVIPFATPIADIAVYEHNVKLWIKTYSADRACGSGATCFRPAMAGVQMIEGYRLIEPVPVPPPKPRPESPYLNARKIPSWLQAKITFGVPIERHWTLYSVAATLSAFGFTEDETIEMLQRSPLWEQGPDDDSRRTARDGWAKGRQG